MENTRQLAELAKNLTPQHSAATGATAGHRHGPHCGSAYHEGDPEWVTVGEQHQDEEVQHLADPADGYATQKGYRSLEAVADVGTNLPPKPGPPPNPGDLHREYTRAGHANPGVPYEPMRRTLSQESATTPMPAGRQS